MPYLGTRTNVEAAIQYARTVMFTEPNGDRPSVPNVIMYISDGGSNVPHKTALLDDAFQAKQDGIHFMVIGIGDWIDENELKAIASHPPETNLIIVKDPTQLPSYVPAIAGSLSKRTLTTS